MKKSSLGVIFHPSFPPESLIDYAKRAEAAGFDELWLWDDCFWAGALTSAGVVLASTTSLRVGIGLMPATVRNPLFTAMDITTLARLYPGRFIPGFGHGVDSWMKQIGAAAPSSLKAVSDTVQAVRGLLHGEKVTMHGDPVYLDRVQMSVTPQIVPPLLIGAMRQKSLELAGRVGDGTILTEMSSPAYVRWARGHVMAGASQPKAVNAEPQIVTYVQAKVGKDARSAVRKVLASSIAWGIPHLEALGIASDAAALIAEHGTTRAATRIPEAWLDELSASGTPEQAALMISRLAEAGATSVVLQPLNGDPACLDEYIKDLLPLLQ